MYVCMYVPFAVTTAFSCRRAKVIQNCNVWTPIFFKKETKRIRVDGT